MAGKKKSVSEPIVDVETNLEGIEQVSEGVIGNDIKLVIDDNTLKKYEEWYFEEYPKRKKKPIDHPWHPSINKWMIMKRPMMNALKQTWKDFMMWFVKEHNCENLKICECDMIFTVYFKTKIRHDVDNIVPKFILDGLVDGCFIIDDDSKHLKSLTLKCDYDKNHPRTEMLITNIIGGDFDVWCKLLCLYA